MLLDEVDDACRVNKAERGLAQVQSPAVHQIAAESVMREKQCRSQYFSLGGHRSSAKGAKIEAPRVR